MSPATLLLLCPAVVVGAVEVDGFFQEWQHLGAPGVRIGGGKDLAIEVRCVRDGEMLNLAIGARDDRFTPTPEKGDGGDRVRLDLGLSSTIELLPGDLEERPATANGLAGVAIDGATRATGWILEVGVPEAPLREAGRWRPDGVDLGLVVRDADAEGPATVMDVRLRLRFPSGAANLKAWLAEVGEVEAPERELLADLGGDERPEWVVAARSVLGVIGEGLGDVGLAGEVLPFDDVGRVSGLEARDLDGDGKAELLVRQALRLGDVEQTLLHLFDWGDQGLEALGVIEIANAGKGWRLENTIRFERGRKAKPGTWADISVRAGRAKGVRETDYRDPDTGIERPYHAMLLPWGFVRKARYFYANGRYLKLVK